MKKLLFVMLLLVVPAVCFGQDVTTVELTLFRQGATAPAVAPMLVPLSQWQCGQTPSPPPTDPVVVNPTRFVLPDPSNQDLACIYTDPPNGVLSMLGYDPVNIYFGQARYINSVGPGDPSPNSNFFSRPGTTPTAAPAYLQLQRGQ